MIRPCCVVALLAFFVGGTAVPAEEKSRIPEEIHTILDKAEAIELLSISPERDNCADAFHGYRVLGTTTVKDAEPRKKLVESFKKGIDGKQGPAADCFVPRHGIRATHDKKTVEFVICFQCRQVRTYLDGKQSVGLPITADPQPTFNEILKAAKVPLAD